MAEQFISDDEFLALDKAGKVSKFSDAPKFISDKDFQSLQSDGRVKNIPSGKLEGLDRIGFAIRSALEGQTLGASEPVISAVKAGLPNLISTVSPFRTGTPPTKDFKTAYKEDVAMRHAEKAENPYLDIAAQVGGAIIPTPLNIALKGGKGVSLLAKAIGLGKAGDKGKLLTIGRGAFIGSTLGAGSEAVRQAAQRPTGFIEGGDAIESITSAGKMGGILGPAFESLANKLAKAPTKEAGIIKKNFSNYFGVPEDAIDDYLARSKEINSAPPISELKDKVDDIIGSLKSKRDTAVAAFKDKARQVKFEVAEKRLDAKDAFTTSRENLDQARNKIVGETAKEVLDALDELKIAVKEGSGKATGILKSEEAAKNFSLARIKSMKALLTRSINSLKVAGETPVDDAAVKSIDSLERLKERLAQLPENITQVDMKRLIQGLDRDLKALYSAPVGSFAAPELAAKSRLRSYVDAILKRESPEYAKAMKSVSEDTRLLKKGSKAFGQESQTIRKLADLDALSNVEAKEILSAMERRLDKQLVSKVREQSLPEYADYLTAKSELENLRPNLINQKIGELLKASPEAEHLKKTTEAFVPVSNIKKSQALLERGIRGKDIDSVTALKYLSSLGKDNFVDAVKNLRTRQAFEGARIQGSRRVMSTAAVVGGVMGAMFGGYGLPGGIAAGAAIGKYMDKYGPAVAKKVLDQIITFKSLPSVTKISELKLPDSVKQDLITEIRAIESPITRALMQKE